MVERPWRVYAGIMNPPAPLHMLFEEAPARLWGAAVSHLSRQASVVIGITGPVGSGKSTLARLLHACVPEGWRGPIIATDDYLPDYEGISPLERDLPEHADLAGLARDLALLKAGRPASVPVWSFKSHRREGVREVGPSTVVICEGIHALHAIPRAQVDLRVFVDAPRDVRWSRWEAIERLGERGFGVEAARVHFDTIAEPTFERRAEEYRGQAHVVVLNHGTR